MGGNWVLLMPVLKADLRDRADPPPWLAFPGGRTALWQTETRHSQGEVPGPRAAGQEQKSQVSGHASQARGGGRDGRGVWPPALGLVLKARSSTPRNGSTLLGGPACSEGLGVPLCCCRPESLTLQGALHFYFASGLVDYVAGVIPRRSRKL